MVLAFWQLLEERVKWSSAHGEYVFRTCKILRDEIELRKEMRSIQVFEDGECEILEEERESLLSIYRRLLIIRGADS